MNFPAVQAIYRFEMARWWRTVLQSIVSPVLSTSLYFVVFGGAIGSRIPEVGGVSYAAFSRTRRGPNCSTVCGPRREASRFCPVGPPTGSSATSASRRSGKCCARARSSC